MFVPSEAFCLRKNLFSFCHFQMESCAKLWELQQLATDNSIWGRAFSLVFDTIHWTLFSCRKSICLQFYLFICFCFVFCFELLPNFKQSSVSTAPLDIKSWPQRTKPGWFCPRLWNTQNWNLGLIKRGQVNPCWKAPMYITSHFCALFGRGGVLVSAGMLFLPMVVSDVVCRGKEMYINSANK